MKDFNYETKKKIAEANGSKVQKNWEEFAGVTKEKFIEGLKWLCESEVDENNHTLRELGCSRKEGLVKLYRVYDDGNNFRGFYRCDNNHIYMNNVSLSPRDRI